MNIGAFGVVAYFERFKGMDLTLIDNYAGLGFKKPLMGVLMSVFLFSLAGIPPMLGFAGKYLVFAAAVQADLILISVIGVLTSAVAAFYYLRVMVYMYMKQPVESFEFSEAGRVFTFVLVFLAIVTVSLGVVPSVIADVIASF
jgi:NADH-quinone oxidoreductase subunit N